MKAGAIAFSATVVRLLRFVVSVVFWPLRWSIGRVWRMLLLRVPLPTRYRILKAAVSPVVRARYRLEVSGEENLPEGGGYAIAANHLGKLDTLIVPVYLPNQMSIAAKKELFEHPLLGLVMVWGGMTMVKRAGATFSETKQFSKQAEAAMENGLVFGIFPEGTRSKSSLLLPFKDGIGFIASSTGRKIVPVGLSYTKGSLWRLRRPTAHIAIGRPIEGAGRRKDDINCELRARIAELSGQQLA